MLHLRSSLAVLCAALVLAACSSGTPASTTASSDPTGSTQASGASAALYDPQALPSGPLGSAIRLGHDIITETQKYAPHNVTADMSCSACHIAGGTVARGGTLVGTYARFPQWNKRSKRVITLQDRLAECFLYSMNGTPPAYTSKEMVALVAYIAYLSRDVKTGSKKPKSDSFVVTMPTGKPDTARGRALYMQKCSACHQAGGGGIHGAFPPLWGSKSFNSGAGMANLANMTGFVHYNMPANAPGSLTITESYDIAAWVLTHSRPKFNGSRVISQPSNPAKFF
jgi:thiosulfate dehydrogenase